MSRNKLIAICLLIIITATVGVGGYFQYENKRASTISGPFHVSMYYHDNVDFFPKSVESFKNTKPLEIPPHVFIVNQHILAAHLIAKQFAISADKKVKTVVLITQNNWNVGRASIITSRYGWKTTLGNMKPALAITDNLINKKLAVADEDIFTREHGITGIVPYIAHSFPNATFVPIVIRDGAETTTTDSIARELAKLDPETTVIIGSIDMSHYLPKYIADAHDRLTVQSIKEFDYEILPRLDIDTVPTLRTIMKVAESAGQRSFVQTGIINSADIVGDPDLMLTTSYITGYFEKNNRTDESNDTGRSVHMLFVGDIMLDRGVAKHARKSGVDSLFSKLERLFLGTHLVIGNLEGTMTTNQSISEKNNSILRFTFNPHYADVLKKLNFSAFSLANNHTLDFARSGYDQTVQNLDNVGLVSFGSSRNDERISNKIIVKDKTICFVGYHDLFIPDPNPAIKEIINIRSDCSYIVLFDHWGEEYKNMPTERQKKLAHYFIDVGADLVIGAHPHVVEPVEIYKNKAIFYSLGNFVFDQNLSFATEHGLAVNVEWNEEKTIFTLIPTALKKTEVEIADLESGKKILEIVTSKKVGTGISAQGALSADITSAILNENKFTIWNKK